MNEINDNDPGFRAEIHKLSENRPALSEMRLDEIKRQVIGRRRRTGSSLSLFLRTRAAIITAIAAGAMMSSGGIALALSGTGSNGTATSAQYGKPGKGPAAANPQGTSSVSGVQVSEQTSAASSGQLPFTGFVAITLVIVGVGLAGTGLVIRFVARERRAPRQ